MMEYQDKTDSMSAAGTEKTAGPAAQPICCCQLAAELERIRAFWEKLGLDPADTPPQDI